MDVQHKKKERKEKKKICQPMQLRLKHYPAKFTSMLIIMVWFIGEQKI